MKIIYVTLFHFSLFVTATSQGFLDQGGDFGKKLDISQVYKCIDQCSNYVIATSCNSLCNMDQKHLAILMNTVYERVKQPICELTFSDIPYGEVQIPLSIDKDNRKCYLKGSLNVNISKGTTYALFSLDSYNTTQPIHKLQTQWDIAFKGLTVYCSTTEPTYPPITDRPSFQSCVNDNVNRPTFTIGQCLVPQTTSTIPPETVGREDVLLLFNNEEIILRHYYLNPPNVLITYGLHIAMAGTFFPEGNLKNINMQALHNAVENAFTTENVLFTLKTYFLTLSKVLIANRILQTCKVC